MDKTIVYVPLKRPERRQRLFQGIYVKNKIKFNTILHTFSVKICYKLKNLSSLR